MQHKDHSLFIRNFTFGVEDSLVSTVGLLAGIAVAGVEQPQIILTGLVLIFVEAVSMGVGSLISEQSVQQYQTNGNAVMRQSISAAAIMFVSYVLAGFIPLSPYFYSASRGAVIASVGLSLVSLFMLGAVSAKMFRSKVWRDGLFTLMMGGAAILVGVAVGQIVGKF